MSLYKRSDLKRRVTNENLRKSEAVDSFTKLAKASVDEKYDIFLSHRFLDADEVQVIYNDLTKLGLKIYVDWIVDKDLNRENITKETVARVRTRMKNCKSLLFVTSENSSSSKWMPWELGFMDAKTDKVAILPVVSDSYTKQTFEGQEYLGIYPFIDKDTEGKIFVNETPDCYVSLTQWLSGVKPYKRT